MKRLFFLVAISFMAFQCDSPKKEKKKKLKPSEDIILNEDAFHFFVIGDWGRNGDDGQQEVADMMGKLGKKMEPEFIITTGDNFYPNGVASVDDPYFYTSFEKIYDGFPLFVPWFVTLGNHDYRGSVQAQIDYSEKSKRWEMPARYYSKQIEEDDFSAQLVMLDTSPLNDEYYSEEKYRGVIGQDTTKQLLWMDSLISQDQSDWKIVIGHHPMYSGGKRKGKKNWVRGHLENRLNDLGVQAYFAGHEHDMQHIKASGPMHHFISGAGSEVRPTGMLDISLYAGSEHAFATVSLTKKEMLVQFIDYKGNMMYSYRIYN